jgi:hypothetical protein
MINDNNSYVQNSSINIRKDNDDWCRAVDTVDVSEVADLVDKTITENGTYAASDDGVSGYSSVSVDVSGGGQFVQATVYSLWDNGNAILPFLVSMVCPDNNKECEIENTYGTYDCPNYSITSEVKKISLSGSPKMYVAFTPSSDFDGFYNYTGKITDLRGDTITPGDGKLYLADVRLTNNYATITKTTEDFIFDIT